MFSLTARVARTSKLINKAKNYSDFSEETDAFCKVLEDGWDGRTGEGPEGEAP